MVVWTTLFFLHVRQYYVDFIHSIDIVCAADATVMSTNM